MATTHHLGTCAVLFVLSVGFPAATISEGSKANTVVPVFVHRSVGSKPCQLLQRGSLVTTKEYAWVEIEGENSETYSPEIGPGDYLSASPPISGRAAKDAHRSGFRLEGEAKIPADLPNVLALDGNANCPRLQSAITEVEQARARRRGELQARIYRPGTDDIVAASPLKELVSKSDQNTATNNLSNSTSTKTKKRFEGTVVLTILIGTEGTVQQSKIARSVNPELDKKAAEEVSRWKFAPARKKGLPVPSVMSVEVNFSLY